MGEKFVLFLQALEKDPVLRSNIENAKSIEEAFELSHPYMEGVKLEEFELGIKVVQAYLNKSDNKLSDEELSSISGGVQIQPIVDYLKLSKNSSLASLASL